MGGIKKEREERREGKIRNMTYRQADPTSHHSTVHDSISHYLVDERKFASKSRVYTDRDPIPMFSNSSTHDLINPL